MEPTGLRRKDTTKGLPLRVLSLDGGGVRGYSMLILLQELMYKTYNETEGKPPTRDQIPKPCDYFDLIAGTGTGGLIAIMLGRLRLDLETCKDVYVRMTRKVFETDKTFAGIPYRSTLFKASKLEEAIRECVREHTIFEDEGNDGADAATRDIPMSPSPSVLGGPHKRQSFTSSMHNGCEAMSPRSSYSGQRWGNANALLYDSRENRTKTAVTAVYKGTSVKGDSTLLRSYDSRKEPAPEFNCTIWQAGRATSATAVAFKPIQIGQSVFIDEGAGKYNPSPQILDEAVINEWPGRDLGVFVSIGTGKRPASTSNRNQHEWWEGFMGGGIGEFAEARRRLISKIEGCEDTHQYMLNEHLPKRGVNRDNYYRLNVEVGVGEFGMNEWQRLADISTSTRRYLAKGEVKRMNEDAAAKLGKIERAKRRHAFQTTKRELDETNVPPPLETLAVELPGDEGRVYQNPRANNLHSSRYTDVSSPQDKFSIVSLVESQRSSAVGASPRRSIEQGQGIDNRLSAAGGSSGPSPRRSHESQMSPDGAGQAPPLPPKTPIQSNRVPMTGTVPNTPVSPLYNFQPRHNTVPRLPYPDDDGPPPVVNMAGKPEFRPR